MGGKTDKPVDEEALDRPVRCAGSPSMARPRSRLEPEEATRASRRSRVESVEVEPDLDEVFDGVR